MNYPSHPLQNSLIRFFSFSQFSQIATALDLVQGATLDLHHHTIDIWNALQFCSGIKAFTHQINDMKMRNVRIQTPKVLGMERESLTSSQKRIHYGHILGCEGSARHFYKCCILSDAIRCYLILSVVFKIAVFILCFACHLVCSQCKSSVTLNWKIKRLLFCSMIFAFCQLFAWNKTTRCVMVLKPKHLFHQEKQWSAILCSFSVKMLSSSDETATSILAAERLTVSSFISFLCPLLWFVSLQQLHPAFCHNSKEADWLWNPQTNWISDLRWMCDNDYC